MDHTAALAECAKRNKHKSKSLVAMTWTPVESAVGHGWSVSLLPCPVHSAKMLRAEADAAYDRAKLALTYGLSSSLSLAAEAMLAGVKAEIAESEAHGGER